MGDFPHFGVYVSRGLWKNRASVGCQQSIKLLRLTVSVTVTVAKLTCD